MDVAGLVLGAVVLIKPICTTIHETLSNYRGFGQDAERLRLRFAVQQARLESLERVLFADGKFAPAMPGRLIDHLPRRTCDDLLGLLRQLYEVLLKYAAVHKEYSREAEADGEGEGEGTREGTTSSKAAMLNMSAGDRMGALLREGKKADAAHQKAVSWARKMLWVAMDRSGMDRLVGDFERWTGQMQALLEAAWWPLSFFETLERMRALERDGDARDVGLLRGIGVRKVLASPVATVPPESRPPEHPAASFRAMTTTASQPGRGGGGLELGQLQSHSTSSTSYYCLVEYKPYSLSTGAAGDFELIRQRVVKLAALLHVATKSDQALRLLPQCIGYFQDPINSRFGLAYGLPSSSSSSSSSSPSSSPSPPATLAALLDAGAGKRSSTASRPSLSARMRLARELSLCVQRLHAYSWLHKSLRSDNILFLSSAAAAATATSTVSIMDTPQIVGFEYARQESDESDRILDADQMRHNIYRHPARWGQSPVRYEKVHDIYALGVILLELGIWSRVDQLDNGALLTPAMAQNPAAVRDRLLKHAHVRLAFHGGDRFRDAVVGCLTGTWQGQPVEDGYPDMVVSLETVANGL